MALPLLSSILRCPSTSGLITQSSNSRCPAPRFVRCMAENATSDHTVVAVPPSIDYPSFWKDDFLLLPEKKNQSKNKEERVKELEEQVRNMLDMAEAPRIDQLELIDTLQRLGVSHRFEEGIHRILMGIFKHDNYGSTDYKSWKKDDLYSTSLEFRLLRQHRLHVPQEVFNSFKDDTDNFNAILGDNTKTILSLYEASYLSMDGETVLQDARDFATKQLWRFIEHNSEDENQNEYMRTMVRHALHLPLHWRMMRLESRWFIDVYQTKPDMNPILLELAILNFTKEQVAYQEDLKYLLRWWSETGLGKQLKFARDRLPQNFLWSTGLASEPQSGYLRRTLAKVITLIFIIDDVYDVYGSMQELQLFTETVERWDVKELEDLPEYMRLCFLSLYNTINEIGFDVLRDKGINVIPHLRDSWGEMCKVFLTETRWHQNQDKPGLSEYMQTARVSSAVPVVLIIAYCILTQNISRDVLDLLSHHPLPEFAGTIFRLANDVLISSGEVERDVPNAIQCYMHESGASEERARQHVRQMMEDMWEHMNRLMRTTCDSLITDHFRDMALNLARSGLCMYQIDDGIGSPNGEARNWISSMFVHPIPSD